MRTPRLITRLILCQLLIVVVCDLCHSAEKPNVLLILVDDLKPAIGCYGDPVAKTPNIDALAARGMRFDLAYCNQAVCAPSRFTLMLGSHSTSTGLYGLGSQLREIVPNAVTIPQHFAKHGGYRTESLGKVFHIGHGNQGDPQSFSVPHFHDKVIEYLDPASTDGGKLTREEAFFTNQKLGQIKSLPRGAAFESPDVADADYADGRVAAETIKRLQAAKLRREEDGTPFFITAGFARPHLPFSAPKKYWDLHDASSLPLPQFEDLPAGAPTVAGKRGGEINNYKPVPQNNDDIDENLKRELIHGYYASTSFVDAQIGKVVDELDRLELADNTIVVLWGDHGFHLGDLGIWTKHTNYEQANRIPILIAAPGVTQSNTSTKQLAESVDIFPTLAELAGLPAPHGPQPIDGVSLVPVLKNPDARVRDHAYHAYPKKKLGRAIRTQRYRLVEWRSFGESAETAEYELYDYETDPLETENLAKKKPAIVAELKQILAKYPPPVDRNGKSPATVSPQIANRELRITAEVESPLPNGVVVAQGGNQHGYALHFVDGKPAFDVRLGGKVTRLAGKTPFKGKVKLTATLDAKAMTLSIGEEQSMTRPSPGLIPAQPVDGLSVGFDGRTAAGKYEAPNRFNGKVLRVRVTPTALPSDKTETQADTPASASNIRKPSPVMDGETIRAGLKSHDKALFIKAGWIRDPHIVLAPDGFYYLTGTTPNPNDPREKTDPYNTGLGEESIVGYQMQLWRSKDLIEWESLGVPFTLLDGFWAKQTPEKFKGDRTHWHLWAPEVHFINGKWHIVHTTPSPVRRGSNLAVTAGDQIKGPYSFPLGDLSKGRHDPSLFQDNDGTVYLLWQNTLVAPLSADMKSFAAEPVRIDPAGSRASPDGKPISRIGHEGATIRKIGDKYVHFGTAWSTDLGRKGSYNLYYCTANKITGPYGPRRFAGRFFGHGTPFQDKDGKWWCTAFFNGNVPPLDRKGIETRDLSETAQTINEQGVTIVPLDVKVLDDGDVHIRAKDPAYAKPGPDEAQKF